MNNNCFSGGIEQKALKRDGLIVAFLFAVITILYFLPVLFSTQTFASRDIYAFFYPRRFFAAETIRNGSIPLWNPYLASGVPFLANLQSSIFYPLSIIYYILPFEMGFKIFIVVHYYLAGFFTYLLMRRWRYGIYPSLVAGVVFMFGGYMVSILDNVAFLTSATWLPLVILFFDRALNERKVQYCIVSGLVIGLQLLAGDASFYILSTFAFMGAYLVYFLVCESIHGLRERIRVAAYFPLAWLIGIGLSSIQLVPFLEFLSYSTRMEGFTFEKMTKWSIWYASNRKNKPSWSFPKKDMENALM